MTMIRRPHNLPVWQSCQQPRPPLERYELRVTPPLRGGSVPQPPPQQYPPRALKALADALQLPPGLAVPLPQQQPGTRWTYARAVDAWSQERARSWPMRARESGTQRVAESVQPRSARGARGRRRR